MHDSGIAKAEVKRRWPFNAFQRPVDDLYPVCPGLLRPRLQVRLVYLYYIGSRRLQAFDLLVDSRRNIQRQGFFIAVIVVLRLLCDGERAWHGDLDATVGVAPQ